MILDDIRKTLFLSLIKSGLGLSGACAKLGISPKEMSEEYLSNEILRKDIDDAFAYGLIQITQKYEEALLDNKENLETLSKLLKSFPSQACLWGSGLNEFQREEIETNGLGVIPMEAVLIKKGLSMYGNLREVATAYAMDYDDLMTIIASDFSLKDLL